MMKRLEAKYAALQVVPVISKLGTQRVSSASLAYNLYIFSHMLINYKKCLGRKPVLGNVAILLFVVCITVAVL